MRVRSRIAISFLGLACAPWPHMAGASELSLRDIDLPTFFIEPKLALVSDNNLFRLPGGETGSFGTQTGRGDTIIQASARIHSMTELNLQRLTLDATITRNELQRFEGLSNTAYAGNAVWNWQVSDRFRGNLGVQASQQLTQFSDLRVPIRNLYRVWRPYIQANYLMLTNLFLYTGFEWIDSTNSDGSQSANNFRRRAFSGGVGHNLQNGGNIRLGYTATRAHFGQLEAIFQPGQPEVLLENDYKQSDIEATIDWPISILTNLSGRIAYTERRHKQNPERNFSGVTASLQAEWTPSVLWTVRLKARRDISLVDDIATNFVTSTGDHLTIIYSPLDNLAIQFDQDYSHRDVRASGLSTDPTLRTDDVVAFQLGLDYLTSQNIRTQLSYRIESRASTLQTYRYHDGVATLTISFRL